MPTVAPVIIRLVKALRATEMPWIGDEIEEHISHGKTPIFSQKDQDKPFDLSEMISREFRDSSEDDVKEFSGEEQIDAALAIIRCHLVEQISLVDDAYRILKNSFALPTVQLAVIDEKNVESPILTDQSREAAKKYAEFENEFRQWLIKESSTIDGK